MTLLEITIALLLVVVLASYALPTYREYAARGHRQLAIDALHAVALDIELAGRAAERAGNTRAPITDMREATPLTEDQRTDAVGRGTPARQWVPTVGRPIYRLRIEQASDRQVHGGYLITAEPVSNGPQAGDRCGVYFLDASGARGNRASRAVSPGDSTNTDTEATAGCWRGR